MKFETPKGHPDVGDSSEPCPFLTPKDRNANANIPPANNGRVPRALPPIVFLDILAVGLVIPLLSKFAKDLGGGAAFTGILGTAYGVTQLFGASILGSVSDVHGRRKVYLLSVVGALVGYSMLLAAASYFQSLPLLFVSRLPIGLVKQTMTCSQSIVCDCTSIGVARSIGLSRLGVAAGLGFIIGPMLGGILSSKSTFLPVKLALALFCVELVIVFAKLPETSPVSRGYVGGKAVAAPSKPEVGTDSSAGDGSMKALSTASTTTDDDADVDKDESPEAALERAFKTNNSKVEEPQQQAGLKFVFKYRAIRDCLMSMLLVDMSYSIMHATFAIYTQQEFDMGTKQTGYTLGYAGILSVGVQLSWPFIGRRLRSWISAHQERKAKAGDVSSQRHVYPEYMLGLVGSSLMVLSFLGILFAPSLKYFLVSLAPLAIGNAL